VSGFGQVGKMGTAGCQVLAVAKVLGRPARFLDLHELCIGHCFCGFLSSNGELLERD
jgi:hypothetical protein